MLLSFKWDVNSESYWAFHLIMEIEWKCLSTIKVILSIKNKRKYFGERVEKCHTHELRPKPLTISAETLTFSPLHSKAANEPVE